MSVWTLRAAAAAMAAALLAAPSGAAGQDDAQQAAPPRELPRPSQPAVAAPRGGGPSWDTLGIRGFSVALVVGDMTGATAADNLPAGAKKALTDMRDFLPYKGYRLLDTHWLLCCSGSGHGVTVSGRLRGAEEEEYAFYINVRPTESAELGVNFNLREVETTVAAAHEVAPFAASMADRERLFAEQLAREDLTRQWNEAIRRYNEAARKLGEQHKDAVALRQESERLERRLKDSRPGQTTPRPTPRASRNILDSTFSMKVGETVVIGTSRLKGDKALIALLTAASKTSAPGR